MTTSQSTRYWLDLFSRKTWGEFRRNGAKVAAFSPKQANRAAVQVDDVLLCYLTGGKAAGLSKFVGTLRVTSPRFEDSTPIYEEDIYPDRFHVEAITLLDSDSGVQIHDLDDQLTRDWRGYVRRTLTEWKQEDAEVVIDACRKAT